MGEGGPPGLPVKVMVQIKFKVLGANSAVGGFSPGDTARVSEAMARHLVEEAGVAEYYTPTPPATVNVQASPAAAPDTSRRQPAKRKPRTAGADVQGDPELARSANQIGAAQAEAPASGTESEATVAAPGAVAEDEQQQQQPAIESPPEA